MPLSRPSVHPNLSLQKEAFVRVANQKKVNLAIMQKGLCGKRDSDSADGRSSLAIPPYFSVNLSISQSAFALDLSP
jgi:hypothetical protein